jgi:hypothetical protein
MIARNGERLAGAGGDEPADPSFMAGMAWAALLAAVLGDTLLDEERAPRSGAPDQRPPQAGGWIPGQAALEARRLAAELREEPPDARSLAASRFVAYALSEIDSGLPGLEPRQAGFTLVTVAVWMAGSEERIAAPLSRRRLLRRSAIDAAVAATGCGFVATVLAELGEALLARSG